MPKGATKYRWSKKQLMEAAERCNDTYTSLAKILGCKSSLTSKQWIHKYKDVEEVFMEKKKQLIDLAEDTLIDCLTSDSDNARL